jgi:hypothetical protein
MSKPSSPSAQAIMDDSADEVPHFSTASPNMPDYWDLPNNQGHTEGQPIVYYGCRRNGGIHLSWLHYITLYMMIFFLSVVITIWTAIAMPRADTILRVQPSNQPYCKAEPLQPAPNGINFSPHIIVGGVKDDEQSVKTVTTVITTMITFSSVSASTSDPTLRLSFPIFPPDTTPARSKESDSNSSVAPAGKPIMAISVSESLVQLTTTLSNSSTEAEPKIKDTATVTTTATTTPPKATVTPLTLYFSSPDASTTGSVWQPLGSGL